MLVAGFLAAPASTATKRFDGNVRGGGTITFLVEFKKGKAKRAGAFELDGIPVACDQGPTEVVFSTQNVVPVKNRKFRYQFNFGDDGSALVKGKVKKNGKKAAGKVSYGPAQLGEEDTNCTTDGLRRWKGSR